MVPIKLANPASGLHNKMKNKKLLLIACITAGAAIWIAVALIRWFLTPNVYDDPALLVELNGNIATLDTRRGRIVGSLRGVSITDTFSKSSKFSEMISVVQRDSVAWHQFDDGTLRIWFLGEDGVLCLNSELQDAQDQGGD